MTTVRWSDEPAMVAPAPHPSRWAPRLRVAALAGAGLCISAYLAAVQTGRAGAPWDPLFGPASSLAVLHSGLARALPIPDAALGVVGYAVELAAALAGGSRRWQTHPWLVVAYGAVASGMALVGLTLVAVQVLVVHAGCTLCLASALVSVGAGGMVWLEGEERAAIGVLTARIS